ncbi:hypothetical protein IT571_03065 [Candidatus Sumerlaeota bacterium]|nr:hypothetical protein [Candidatus Sumerlaeota bacterium]
MNDGQPAEGTVSGRKVAVAIFLALLVIAFATYFLVPKLVIPYYAAKPAQTRQLFAGLSTALLAYRTDHGAFPPEDDLTHYRKVSKNLAKSHSVGMSTYRAVVLTTPVAYLDPRTISDPYAMPDQYAPPAYIRGTLKDGSEYAILCSPGPNLTYELRPPAFRLIHDRASLAAALASHQYDPTNGARSHGDFYHALIARPDSSVDRLDGVIVH